MATFKRFEDIDSWQKARDLTKEIYRISALPGFTKDYGLREQIRRASVSVMSNIAEGFERSGTGEFVQFLSIAKGSVGEVRSQLFVSLDQKYIGNNEFDTLYKRTIEISRMLSGLMDYLCNSRMKGTKFKIKE